MQRIPAQSAQSKLANDLVIALQQRFVNGLERLANSLGMPQKFTATEWFRDAGTHGGGTRLATADGPMLGRGSVNVSQVHYDDNPAKQLASATALSTIMHPCHPHAPSVHIHISWTEMRDGSGYWRMMADLNPALEKTTATQQFLTALQHAAPAQFKKAKEQGERYFYIPVLRRHRGVAHFYLEQYYTGDADADFALAQSVGEASIDTYLDILEHALKRPKAATPADEAAQLAYHSLYFFQVLTLDRGTTSGLLVHNQNDVGILGSLPAYVDKELLSSWLENMPAPQDQLLAALIAALPNQAPALVSDDVKAKLAEVVRQHYIKHPEAIAMQASGELIPPTVNNHR